MDVGATLLFPSPSLGAIYGRVARQHGIRVSPDAVEREFPEAWRRTQDRCEGLIYGTDHTHALRFWMAVNRQILDGAQVDDETIEAFVTALYFHFAEAEQWRVHPSWATLRDACRASGIPLLLLSNWDARLPGLLRRVGLDRDVDHCVLSCDYGLEKPDPAFFRVAVERLGVQPGDVLHIGDTWRDDVLGALRVGMRAAWYNPTGTPLPDPDTGAIDLRDLSDLVSADGTVAPAPVSEAQPADLPQ